MSTEKQKMGLTRRGLFSRTADGLFSASLLHLLGRDAFSTPPPGGYDLSPKSPHFKPKARAVIQLFMTGGPSQMDLFDPKPMLDKHHGEPYFDKVAQFLTGPEEAGGLMRSPYKFSQRGESGLWVSDAMPHLAQQADDLCVIRSMFTTHPNHEPALYKIHCGQIFPGLPSIGSWVVYGLGSESQNLPAYVVLEDPGGLPTNGTQNWQSGYLPPIYQGTRFRATGSPILNLRPGVQQPDEIGVARRELIENLNRIHKQNNPGYLDLDARVASYGLAARMQLAASEAIDFSGESKQTLEMYGVGQEPTDSYARRCLLARRLVEHGVRFVQVFIAGGLWDSHSELEKGHTAACRYTDQPIAALLRDLKQRGMLQDTLVLWGGEFGRTPTAQNGTGRDHGMRGFTTWMAGGGVKGGTAYGTTDDFGFEAVEKPVSVADWHATILHLLGMHNEGLFFEHSGFKERITGVEKVGVIEEILA